MSHHRIVLIGPRGCGKTTLGRALAAHLRREFVDLDERVLESFDEPTVQRVWDRFGEKAWRAAEVEQLERVLAEAAPCVLATGGGVPMIAEARTLLQSQRDAGSAAIVYLRGSVETLENRLQHDPGDRPALTSHTDLRAEIEQVLTARSPTYEALADVIIDIDESAESTIPGSADSAGPASQQAIITEILARL